MAHKFTVLPLRTKDSTIARTVYSVITAQAFLETKNGRIKSLPFARMDHLTTVRLTVCWAVDDRWKTCQFLSSVVEQSHHSQTAVESQSRWNCNRRITSPELLAVNRHHGGTTIIIIIIIISWTIFIALSSWPQGHCESSLGSSDECRTASSGRRPSDQVTWLGLWVRLACRLSSTTVIAIYYYARP